VSLPIERYTLGHSEHVALSMVPCQAKPHPLRIRVEGIPEAMRAEQRWVVWKYEWREGKPGKWTKTPYIATAPQTHAKSTDPTTWRTFADALAQKLCDGIGFVLGDGWVGYDYDAAGIPEHVQLLNSYTERSPSGKIHVLMRGSKPPGRCRVGPYELYDHGRYFKVTGQHVPNTPTTVEERTAEIATLHGLLFPTEAEASAPQAHYPEHHER
jgi:primase-polymerase (primpol)-like protein